MSNNNNKNEYTKYAFITDRKDWTSPTRPFWRSYLQAELCGPEPLDAEGFDVVRFAKNLTPTVCENEYHRYALVPVYSYRLKRKANLRLVKAFLDEDVLDAEEFLRYHKADLTALLGPKAYRRLWKMYK